MLFGILILFAGLLLVAKPEIVFGFLGNNTANVAIYIFAVAVRLVIGLLLITQSDLSKFPLLIEVLGWIFILAGLGMAAMGRKRFSQLMSWVLTNLKHFGRLAGGLAILFGGFLIYAFL